MNYRIIEKFSAIYIYTMSPCIVEFECKYIVGLSVHCLNYYTVLYSSHQLPKITILTIIIVIDLPYGSDICNFFYIEIIGVENEGRTQIFP